MTGFDLFPGQELSGFRVDTVKELAEFASLGVTLTHLTTGCRVFHLFNEDRENAFSFNFRTPPFDSSGVAHILEHSVLCGSKRFPLKDPFVALLKGSMKTFLNALTFPDKTIYPGSSTNQKDFYNILHVYGDAVFFPLLKKEVFDQEGFHLEYSEPGNDKSALKVVGVVYNEMRGNYSSQESIVSEWSLRSLFPDTPYGFDSGGEPLHILRLSYEDFLDFHRFYYHPSNCLIYFYGNIPTEKHLEFLESRFLKHFKKNTVNSDIPLQKPFTAPVLIKRSYPCKKGEALDAKTTITVNWVLPQVTDAHNLLVWEVLGEILLGNAGAPLWKALVESGLGQDVYPYGGLENEVRQMVFTVGLRGSEPDRYKKLEELILDTLEALCTKKIDGELIQAALNRLAFYYREIIGGQFPYGLHLLRRILRGWLHGEPPEETLIFESHFKRLMTILENKEDYLERFIRKYLIANSHRSTVIVAPDPEFTDKENQSLKEYIRDVERTLTAEKKGKLISRIETLKIFQESKETAGDAKKIPHLRLKDLPQTVELVTGREEVLANGLKVFFHPMFTNNITYLDFSFSVSGMEPELMLFVPLFGRLVCKAGLPGVGYDVVQRRLALLSGGFSAELLAQNVMGKDQGREEVIFRVKLLNPQLQDGIKLVIDLLRQADFSDKAHSQDLIREFYNNVKASLIPRGHNYALIRSGSRLSRALAIQDKWEGVEQFLFLHELLKNPPQKLDDIAARLQKIRSHLLSGRRLKINITAEENIIPGAWMAIRDELSDLPAAAQEKEMESIAFPSPDFPLFETLLFSASINFIAHSLRGALFGTKEYAAEAVMGHLLNTGYLWEKVRMRGGAYGVFSLPVGMEALFSFASYRDPNISSTLEAFKTALQVLASGTLGHDEVEKAIIGTVSQYEIPYRPHDKGFLAFKRKLLRVSDELRQKNRDYILRINGKALKHRAGGLLEQYETGSTVVLTHQDKIKQEKADNKKMLRNILQLPV
jgi:Zn-dependent M16 (insulinase) family peptidase